MADTRKGQSHYLLQLTDSHLMPEPGQLFRGLDSDATLQAVVVDALATRIPFDLLLLSGDLVHHGESRAYRRLLDLVAPLPGERHWIPGNHDALGAMQGAANLACGNEEVRLGNWRLLLLDSTGYPDGRGGGSLGEEGLDWLDRQLRHDTEQPVLIALHHNPVATDSRWQDSIMLGDAARFRALVEQRPQVRAILCGHLHQHQALHIGHIPLWCSPATSIQFKPGQSEFMLEDDPDRARPGYTWYRLDPDGQVTAHPRWVGSVAPAVDLG